MGAFDRLRRSAKPASKRSLKPGLIGLEIGSENLHLCQLRAEPDQRYTIVAKASVSLPVPRSQLMESPALFKSLVVKALKGKGFKGRHVTAIMPPDEVKIMLLSYKSGVHDVDAEIVRMVGQRVSGDIDDYVIDYLPVRNKNTDDEHMVMASVCRQDKVNGFLKLLESAGLEPHSLDIGPSALRRLISVLYSDDKTSNVLLINTTEESSYLTIVSGRRLLFDQPVKFGCSHLFEQLAEALDVPIEKARQLVEQHGFSATSLPLAETHGKSNPEIAQTLREIVKPAFLSLVEEINRVLIFTSSETHGVPLSRVYLLGCAARLPGAHDVMLSMLDVPIAQDHHDFNQVFQDENDHTEAWSNRLPELAIATGLALRGMQADE